MHKSKSNLLAMLDLNRWAVVLLCLLLATDLAFIILHLIYSYTSLLALDKLIPANVFSLETDRGYSELFQYIKEYWIALLLGVLALRNRSLLYLSWSLLFAFLLLDDAVGLHEKIGVFTSQKFAFGSLFRLRPIDFGELLATAIAGFFFLGAIALTHRQSDRSAREVSKKLMVLLFALAFFGVAIDMLHVALKTPVTDPLLIVLEDGGELMVMSLITSFILSRSLARQAEQRNELKAFARHF